VHSSEAWRLTSPRLLAAFRGVTLEFSAALIAVVQKLLRGAHLGVGCLLHAERPADLVHHVLVRRGDGSPHRLFARALRAGPIRVTSPPARAGLVPWRASASRRSSALSAADSSMAVLGVRRLFAFRFIGISLVTVGCKVGASGGDLRARSGAIANDKPARPLFGVPLFPGLDWVTLAKLAAPFERLRSARARWSSGG
jgi:hypothetical protein